MRGRPIGGQAGASAALHGKVQRGIAAQSLSELRAAAAVARRRCEFAGVAIDGAAWDAFVAELLRAEGGAQ